MKNSYISEDFLKLGTKSQIKMAKHLINKISKEGSFRILCEELNLLSDTTADKNDYLLCCIIENPEIFSPYYSLFFTANIFVEALTIYFLNGTKKRLKQYYTSYFQGTNNLLKFFYDEYKIFMDKKLKNLVKEKLNENEEAV